MKTTLTIKQSAELIKRGVSANKASDTYVGRWEHSSEGSFADPESVEPLFTLADLLSLLPKHIRIEHRHYYLRMNTFVLINEENPMWIARYITSNSAITLHERWSEELIDALYKLIISLLDNHVKLD